MLQTVRVPLGAFGSTAMSYRSARLIFDRTASGAICWPAPVCSTPATLVVGAATAAATDQAEMEVTSTEALLARGTLLTLVDGADRASLGALDKSALKCMNRR